MIIKTSNTNNHLFSIFGYQIFHKSHLSKLRVSPSETALSDVRREVLMIYYYAF